MLQENQITGYQRLYMLPEKMDNTWKNVSTFKHKTRMHIKQKNFMICCFGDMWTDHFPLEQDKLYNTLKEKCNPDDCVFWFIDKTCYIKLPES